MHDIDGYAGAKLMLGFGGEADVDIEGLGGFLDGPDDLETTYGVGLLYMHPLHEYFVLGGQLSFLSWTTDGLEDNDLDRSVLLDISVVPQGRYAVAPNIELYASLPLGLTFDFFGEDDFANAEVSTGFGFNFGLLFGVRAGLSKEFGLFGELGYLFHSFSHGTEVSGEDGPDFDVSMGQLTINIGGYYQL